MKISRNLVLNQKSGLVFSLLLPTILLSALLIQPLMAYQYGHELILKTVPVDPRDVFFGDYVTLDFEIEETTLAMLPADARKHDYEKDGPLTLYLKMKKSGKYDVVDNISVKKPPFGGKYIKARLNYYTSPEEFDPRYAENADDPIFLDIGLDSYYSSEEKAKLFSELNHKRELAAKVKVNNGFAIITGLVTFPAE